MNHFSSFIQSIITWFRTITSRIVSSIRNHTTIALVILIISSLLITATILYPPATWKSLLTKTTLTPTPTPTPTPYPINFHGKMEFTVSSGNRTGPIFVKGYLDPFDVLPGKDQALRIYITDTAPLTNVFATWETDTRKETINLKLVEGTTNKGWWEGVWVAKDTYLYRLNINLVATDGTETNSATMTWR